MRCRVDVGETGASPVMPGFSRGIRIDIMKMLVTAVVLLFPILWCYMAFSDPADSAAQPVSGRDPNDGLGLTVPVETPSVARLEQGPLSLQDCIDIALANNPDVAASAWAVHAAEASRDETAAQRWPWVHARGAYTRSLDNAILVPFRKPGAPSTFTDDIFAGDLVMTMPIFTGGRITNRIKAADLLEQAAQHTLVRTRNELVFNVSSVFYAILSQQRVIDSVEFTRKALREHRDRVGRMIAVQKATNVDLLRTEVRLADVEQRLVNEKNVLDIEKRTLVNLLGIEDANGAVRIQGLLDHADVTSDLDRDLEKAYATRPDYLAARAAVDAQARNVDAVRGEYWPTVSLEGSYGGRWAIDPELKQPGANESEDIGHVGVVVDVPLFEGGGIRAQVSRERAKLRVARETLRKLELQIRLEVESAELNIASAGERVRATEKAVEQAKESFRIEQEKYGLGRGSITDVLDAQAAMLESETSYYRALADYNTSVAQLRLATGEE